MVRPVSNNRNRLVTISKELFNDHSVDIIGPPLKALGILGLVASMKYNRVVVMNAGLRHKI